MCKTMNVWLFVMCFMLFSAMSMAAHDVPLGYAGIQFAGADVVIDGVASADVSTLENSAMENTEYTMAKSKGGCSGSPGAWLSVACSSDHKVVDRYSLAKSKPGGTLLKTAFFRYRHYASRRDSGKILPMTVVR